MPKLSMSAPVLVAPDFSKLLSLAIEARDTGAGAVLLQSAQEHEHLVCFFSKKFNRALRNYATIEKEALALVLAIQQFEVYLGLSSQPIVVYTDHDPLKFLNRMFNSNRCLMRWNLLLKPFDLRISHIGGKDNVVTDAMVAR